MTAPGVCLPGVLYSYASPHLDFMNNFKKIDKFALTGMAQWVGYHPANQKIANLMPGQGTGLGCGLGPQLGLCERQLIDVSLSH